GMSEAHTVPNDAEINFVIQDGHIVDTDEDRTINHLTIQTGGTLTFSDQHTLTLHGNLANEGSITSGTGTIEFSGEKSQNFTSTNALTLNNIIINNDGESVTFPDNVTTAIKSDALVTIPRGTFYTNDNLILLSTSAGTASIGEIGNTASLIGQVTLE